jgi:serine/threonine protein kinase
MPFTDEDVVRAFNELTVEVPNLGAGQQKVAYKASDDATTVALKILLQDETDDEDDELAIAAERFRRELAGMAATSCPHVVQLLNGPEVREIAGREHLWYTEPFMAGGMLRSKLAGGPMNPSEVHALARALLLAVDAMWSQGKFVHRDIKPGNIGFLSDGTAVLLDLGIALFTDLSALTESQMNGPGTARYAAPEQFSIRRLAEIDFRTDLFQIGIVLVEALTGKHPFFALGTDYYQRLTSFSADSLNEVQMTDGLREVIPRLLAANPSGRYRKVELALAALGEDA